MGIVFVPNIHGNKTHYTGGILPQMKKAEDFRDIKSRYLASVVAQLPSQQGRGNNRYIQKLLNLGIGESQELEELEQGIEEALVMQYNSAVSSFGGPSDLMQRYGEIASDISTAFKKVAADQKAGRDTSSSKQVAQIELDNLFTLLENNSRAVSLYRQFKDDPESPAVVTLTELMGYTTLKNALDKIAEGENTNERGDPINLGRQLTTMLAQPAEFLSTFIDAFAEIKISSLPEMAELMSSRMLGRKSTAVDFLGGKVQSKAADFQAGSRRVNVQTQADPNNGVVTHRFNIAPYASVKAYRSAHSSLGLVSSERKEILMDMVKSIYSSQYEYQYYNSLAFQSLDHRTGQLYSKDLDTNFRIIRSDITATFAEKFIAGFNAQQAQQLFVYNFRAYPMLYVIQAIVEDALSKSERAYGSLSAGDLFSVSFATVGNKWEPLQGTGDTPQDAKSRRISRVVTALSKVQVQGRLNRQSFEAMVGGKLNRLEGIAI